MGPQLQRLQTVALGMAAVGGVLCLLGFMGNQKAFFHSYLFAYMFWAGVTFGSVGLLMLHHTVGGGWGFVIRRFLEAGSRLLPLVAVLFIPVVIGMMKFDLYEWTHPEGDVILQAKQGYLNVPFFLARTVIYFVVFGLFAAALNRLGNTQDERSDLNISNKLNMIGAGGMLAYMIFMTFVSVDWVMSLTPHWFSSIFGLFTVASQALSTFALMLVLLKFLAADTPLLRALPTEFFRDLGNLTLATVMLWAYMAFSQYLITFSGNTVEEAPWYVAHNRNGWLYISATLIAFHFALPFWVLLTGSKIKRDPKKLGWVALFIVVMRFVDLFWIIAPSFRPSISFSFADFGAPLFIGGIWLFCWAWQLKGKKVVPIHDPRLEPYLQEAPAHG
jgi:hypothetical protein